MLPAKPKINERYAKSNLDRLAGAPQRSLATRTFASVTARYRDQTCVLPAAATQPMELRPATAAVSQRPRPVGIAIGAIRFPSTTAARASGSTQLLSLIHRRSVQL